MKFSLAFIAALLSASGAVAAPAANSADTVFMMAASPQWTVESLKRVCDEPDTACTWIFKIYTHKGAATDCKLIVKGQHASHGTSEVAKCGDFTVSSSWSGPFGFGSFNTLAILNKSRQIIFPVYTDEQLADGKVVAPDQSYAPIALPQ
ncbi:hypothetical protein FZEAL_7867 [Fusarium zealandicum]|uniref:Small secreted protein n=1 Tax=Fusarium zealandicum TaxID=1053134 RepID=A0A8H4UFL5_9HYPO|nr:hypothetical protein FZEAL_7867 [Fusarium zealandicum]